MGASIVWRLFLLAAGLFACSVPARAAWFEAKTNHFIIYSDQRAEEVRDFATRLEKFDSAVRFARSMSDPPLSDSGKLRVYVLRDQNAVARMAGSPDSGIAGFYVSDITGARAFVYRKRGEEAKFGMTPEVVFFHEYFHHLMLGHTDAAMPRWVVEGFAEFFSTASIEDDGTVLLGRPAEHRATPLFLLADLSVRKMLEDSDKTLSGGETMMLYGRGWLLAHYLAFEPSRKGQLDQYLRKVQLGEPTLPAAEAAFGDLRELGRELDRYLKQKTLPAFRVPAEKLNVGRIAIRFLSPAESAILDARMRLDRRSNLRQSDAAKIAMDAHGVADRFPSEPLVHSTVARARLAAGQYSAALEAADRTLALNPRDVEALIVKARAQLRMAAASPKSANWPAVRESILRANRADPENAEPLALFYESFLASGSPPTPNATKGLLYARVLMPQDDDLRLMAARQLVTDGRFAEAKATLIPMAYDPHSKTRELAAEAVTATSTADRETTLAALDKLEAKRKAEREKDYRVEIDLDLWTRPPLLP